jgi:hypothetical protein
MAFQMLCLREPPFAIPTFLREEAPVPVLHWTGRHHLRTVVLVWGQLIRDTTLNDLAAGALCPSHAGRMQRESSWQTTTTNSWAAEGELRLWEGEEERGIRDAGVTDGRLR